MTSRRSPPRRSSGSRAPLGALVFVVALLAGGAAPGAEAVLTEMRDGAEIDWAAGTVTAAGGAAADLRMPSADVARPGAVRRAEASARAQLGRALAELPLGGGRKLSAAAIERTLGRARVSGTEYQSNGGALVRVTARFGDWLEAAAEADAAPVAVLTMSAMPLGAAPLARWGAGRQGELGAAIYRVGVPPKDAHPLPAKLDRAGHVAVDASAGLAQKLARGLTLIYVQKVVK
jgi:hypothetical protein